MAIRSGILAQKTARTEEAGGYSPWGHKESDTMATEDEMVGWHHRLNELEFEQTTGDSERQGS